MKYLKILLVVVFLSSCKRSTDSSNVYIRDSKMFIERIGNNNFFIENDTIYKSTSKYIAIDNKLYYKVLNLKEKNIIDKIYQFDKDATYKKHLSEYKYYLEISVKRKKRLININVLDSTIPNPLKALYGLINKAFDVKDMKMIKNSKSLIFEEIILTGLVNKKDTIRLSNRAAFLLWKDLMTSKENQLNIFKEGEEKTIIYNVLFSYLLDARYKNIDKIQITSDNKLVFKLKSLPNKYYIKMRPDNLLRMDRHPY